MTLKTTFTLLLICSWHASIILSMDKKHSALKKDLPKKSSNCILKRRNAMQPEHVYEDLASCQPSKKDDNDFDLMIEAIKATNEISKEAMLEEFKNLLENT